MAKMKICLVCKKYIVLDKYAEHFRECRKKQLKDTKIKLIKSTEQKKKTGDCGCKKKKF